MIRPPAAWLLPLALVFFSWWSVYTRYVDLQATSLVVNRPFSEWSLEQYHETLAGTRAFPYQWRVLGIWMVRAGEQLTGADPHLIDAGVKTMALAAAAWFLFVFATTVADVAAALLAAALFLLLTAAAFASEGYAIYYTNDYLAIAAWFAAVYAARQKKWGFVALAVFIGAWARETMVLAVILLALEAWRGRAPWSAVALSAAAFAVPTMTLRAIYPAPIAHWAWWDNVTVNIPFLVLERTAIARAVRANLKVLLFLNVLWILAVVRWRRASDPFLRSLGITLLCYAGMVWPLVHVRELRHALPFTILILPLAVAAITPGASREPSHSL